MNATSNKNIKFISKEIKGCCFAFIICLAIIAGTFSNIFSYGAFMLVIIAIAILSEENVLSIFMFIMPFANIFKASPTSQSFFTYLILIYIFFHAFKIYQIHREFMIAFFILIMILLIQMFFCADILRLVKFVANIIYIYFVTVLNEKNNNQKIYCFYIGGVFISSQIAVLNIIPNLDIYIGTKDLWYQNERISRFSGMYADPNYYSVNIIISLCLIVILNYKKELSDIVALFLAMFMLYFAGLTSSKSAFLMLILPLLLLIYSNIHKKKYYTCACIVGVCAMFIIAVFSGKIEMFNTILYRLNEASDAASFTTGRSSIWLNYIGFLCENPKTLLFGKGFGAEVLGTHAAHNTYIDLFYYLGLIGTVVLIIIFYILLRLNKFSKKNNLLNYSIWLCIAIMYFFLSELFYFDWVFHIIIAILVLKMDMDEIC